MELTTTNETSWVLVLLLVSALAYPLLFRRKDPDLSHIPILRKELGGIDALRTEYGKKGAEMLEEGYRKVGIAVCKYPTSRASNHGAVQEWRLSNLWH